ncbi:MAG: hypothetical protein IKO78_03000 [Bacilli bacterium]|nr:hypothetical protein [Bacilli bacterium]
MKKHIMVLAPFFFLIGIYLLIGSYGLFESERTNTSQIDIAKWQVKVNNDSIDGSTSTFTVDNINWNSSPNVKEGKIAPGGSGYFDIVIDPNDTDVSIIYNITFDFSNLDEDQFQIDEIIELDNKPIVHTDTYTYSNIMTLDDINNNETNTIRVYLSWVNDENNNEKDSDLGKVYNNSIEIPITVEILQYMDGDTLTSIEENTP